MSGHRSHYHYHVWTEVWPTRPVVLYIHRPLIGKMWGKTRRPIAARGRAGPAPAVTLCSESNE